MDRGAYSKTRIDASRRSGAPYPKHFRLGYTRRKTGCLPCRRRKKKCDETHPHCTSCKRNNLKCEWSDKPNIPVANKVSSSESTPFAIDSLLSIRSGQACELTPDSFQLLEHYTGVTAPQLPAYIQNQMRNPFINYILPVAFEDDLLMHAVLAVSGAHLSHKLPRATSLELATHKHYSYVLRRLQSEILQCFSGDTTRVIRLLLVPAFLCLYEVRSPEQETSLSSDVLLIRRSSPGPLIQHYPSTFRRSSRD